MTSRESAGTESRQFGHTPDGVAVTERPGAYAVVLDEARRVLCCIHEGALYLPGGGVEPGETAEQAIEREVAEETGLALIDPAAFARAGQIVVVERTGAYVNKLCTFFTGAVGERVRVVARQEHETAWVEVGEALARLAEPASAWAVTEVLGRKARA